MRPQASMLTLQVIRDGLGYLLNGGFKLSEGHLPPPHRTVPEDFFGVGVASNANPATDAYIIDKLQALGVLQVRLDLSYDDIISYQGRFCEALLDAGFAVTLRLIPPFESAKKMHLAAEQASWSAFIDAVLKLYGNRVEQIEIGNTINRKRWAGYHWQSFFAAWAIAHQAIKAQNITLLGANIQDFEPVYNVSLLKALREKNQLPDVQTDNLFVERVSEPERFDHRILKYRWAKLFKFNLVKKARLLNKIGRDFNVPDTSSTGAFWAIYRIERKLVHGAQKQADYLTRYFTLLAASGGLRQAFWATLLCHREGLIDDAVQDAEYPALERIARYQTADGELANYQLQPSFAAMQTVVNNLRGAQYFGYLASGAGLEIHRFLQHGQQLHVAWTINGVAIPLQEIYAQTSLAAASYQHRDGQDFAADTPDLLCEEPIYMHWPADFVVETVATPRLTTPLAIDAHRPDNGYFTCLQPGWQGVIAAKNQAEAAQLLAALNPENLLPPERMQALRHARNVIWTMPHPTDSSRQITVKKPVKMYWHKTVLDRYRPSKARRSWNAAMQLSRRGIATATPLAFFEKQNDKSLKQNFFICEFVPADCHIGQLFSAFSAGESEFMGIAPELAYAKLARFIGQMHSRGCYFRDLSGGNILVNIHAENSQAMTLQFTLIDTARARFSDDSVPMRQRLSDMARTCNKLHWAGRERFLGHYFACIGGQLMWYHQWPFYLYDAKVWLKRRVGRKGIKRLIKRLKGEV